MTGAPESRRQRRGRIDPERVVRLAIEIIDRDGLEAVTMRRIASELSVTPMSLYRHFDDKAELLLGVSEQIGREIEALRRQRPLAPNADIWDRLHERLRPPVEVLMNHHQDITQLLQAQSLARDGRAFSSEVIANHEQALQLFAALGITGLDAARWIYLLRQSVFMLANACRDDERPPQGSSNSDRRVREYRQQNQAAAPTTNRSTASVKQAESDSHDDAGSLLDHGIEMLVAAIRQRTLSDASNRRSKPASTADSSRRP